MAVDIDTLQIEIEASSDEAAKRVQELANALSNLKNNAKGGAGLTTVSKQLHAIVEATSGGTSASNKINKLVSALHSLEKVQKPAALSSVANSLNKLNGVDLSDVSTEKMQTLASALNQLGSVQKATGLASTVNALKKLPTISAELKNADLDVFATQMKQVAAAMAPLANEMQKVSNGFAAFPIRIQKIIASNTGLAASNQKAAKSFDLFGSGITRAISKLTIFGFGIKQAVSAIGGFVTRSNDYVENVNLFSVVMGDGTQAALEYAEQVQDALGIDMSEFIRYQGVFKGIADGFGIASDKAELMSKNLTQLVYDYSSLWNIDIETSAEKLRSAIAGEIEPVRALGKAVSVAALQEVAYAHGITQTVASMTEGQKAQLRYIAIMEQSQNEFQDMARTIISPANALRILDQQINRLSRALGNLLIPFLMKVVPYVQAFVEVVTEAIQALAVLVGFKLPTVDYSDYGDALGGITGGADEATDAMGEASKAAKDLKNATLGIDELNIISPQTSAGAGGAAGGAGGDLGLELKGYDFLKNIRDQTNELKEKMKTLLNNYVLPIGVAFAAWSVSKALLSAIDRIKSLSSKSLTFQIGFKAIGLAMFLADLKEFMKYFEDWKENGANFHNVAGMISEFSGMVGDALIILGNLKLGGALKIIQGVGEIVVAIEDISKNGIDWDNALTAVRGLTNISIGIGVFTGNIKLAAWGVAIQGFTTIIQELATNWEAIKQGDWSGIDRVTLIVGGLEILGGLVVALDVFSKLKGISSMGNATQAVQAATDATGSIAGATGGLSPNLTSLAKNLGLGIAIIAEVSAAAIIFVGAIAIIGYELEEVGKAWEPVINNGPTIAISIGIGTGILAAIGLATYGLGTLGVTAAINVGIGTGVLAELGIATGLFLIEIWAIGKGLDEIGKAWQPVLDNGETIASGIGLGTTLLVGIGVVTAALGAITIASAGTLPAAILVGTAILVELSAAFVLFTESIVAVSDELSGSLAPSLSGLNQKLPSLGTNMSNFVDYMTVFADEVSSYTSSMGNITWSSIASGFQKLFVGEPIQSLADDVSTIATDASELNDKLLLANPELETAVTLLTKYSELMSQLQILTDKNGTVNLETEIFTNLKAAGENLVIGFVSGMGEQIPLVSEKVGEIQTILNTGMDAAVLQTQTKLSTLFNTFTQWQANFLSGMGNFKTAFLENWGGLWFGAAEMFVNAWNLILDSLQQGINSAVRSLNSLVREANALWLLTGKTYSYVSQITVEKISVPTFELGGFPEHGQMFIAREAGPELVGTIGNRTAVANNDQIISSIQAAVYQAMMEAMSQQQQQPIVIDQKINLDGKQITSNVEKHQRERGATIMAGGVMV